MSKSKCTQYQYKKQWKGQTSLDSFGFNKKIPMDLAAEPVMLHHERASEDCGSCQVLISAHLLLLGAVIPRACTSSTRSASSESENGWDVPQLMDVLGPQADTSEAEENPRDESKPGEELDGNLMESSDAEAWEEELDMTMKPGSATQIRSWDELCDQIKDDLTKHSKTLPVSRIHQLLILSNFATLQLKGLSRIGASFEIARQWQDGKGTGFARRVRALAHHYQVFEQLPRETRGGGRNARSYLHDKSVQSRCCAWLSSLSAGKVTPQGLQRVVHTTIFPELGITPKCSISE